MRILIFEGIATSGKSTLIKRLESSMSDKRITVVGEPETHIPIMNETSDTHLPFFTSVIERKMALDTDVVIFDRLYLTQAYRAKVSLAPYAPIEQLLATFQPFTAFLRVRDEAIAERIFKASQHRDDTWKDYIWTKGQNIEQIAQYYINQQASQLELLKTSAIPYGVFDTTEHNYAEITEKLLNAIA